MFLPVKIDSYNHSKVFITPFLFNNFLLILALKFIFIPEK